jgi:hypothetical protein
MREIRKTPGFKPSYSRAYTVAHQSYYINLIFQAQKQSQMRQAFRTQTARPAPKTKKARLYTAADAQIIQRMAEKLREDLRRGRHLPPGARPRRK